MASIVQKQDRDPRRVAWSLNSAEGASALVHDAQAALRARMAPRVPTARDLNELDTRLVTAWEAVEGSSRAPPLYHVSSEENRMVMPHCALEGGAESEALRRRYNVSEFPPESSALDAMAHARRPEVLAVALAVELTLPFTYTSANDDDLFTRERWRAHTVTDVLQSKTDAVPLTTEARPMPPDVANEDLTVINTHTYDMDPPIYDGTISWFEGWDAHFQGL